jgi:hypothetical protein
MKGAPIDYVRKFQPTELSAHLRRRFNAARAVDEIRPSAERVGQHNHIANSRWNALAGLNKFGAGSD